MFGTRSSVDFPAEPNPQIVGDLDPAWHELKPFQSAFGLDRFQVIRDAVGWSNAKCICYLANRKNTACFGFEDSNETENLFLSWS